MAKTRKQLQTENTELRAQLAAHNHETRKALNARVQKIGGEAALLRHENRSHLNTIGDLKTRVAQLEDLLPDPADLAAAENNQHATA